MNKIHFHAVFAIFSWIVSADVLAQVYKCEGIDGTISYQEASCDPTQQKSLPITIKTQIHTANEQSSVHPDTEEQTISHTDKYKNKFLSLANPVLEKSPDLIKNNYIIVSIALFILILFIIKSFFNTKPKEKEFTCSRCNKLSPHNHRTIEALRNDKKALFCQECHSKWLRSQPMRPSRPQQASNSGCLGIAIIFAAIPLALFFI